MVEKYHFADRNLCPYCKRRLRLRDQIARIGVDISYGEWGKYLHKPQYPNLLPKWSDMGSVWRREVLSATVFQGTQFLVEGGYGQWTLFRHQRFLNNLNLSSSHLWNDLDSTLKSSNDCYGQRWRKHSKWFSTFSCELKVSVAWNFFATVNDVNDSKRLRF